MPVNLSPQFHPRCLTSFLTTPLLVFGPASLWLELLQGVRIPLQSRETWGLDSVRPRARAERGSWGVWRSCTSPFGTQASGCRHPSVWTWVPINRVCKTCFCLQTWFAGGWANQALDTQCHVLLPGWVMGLWAARASPPSLLDAFGCRRPPEQTQLEA